MNVTRNFDQLQENGQSLRSTEEVLRWSLESRLKDLHTALPGVIVQFNSVTQTAQVQPLIRRIFMDKGAVNLPVCVDCPVVFPGGGGFFLTFPVAAGDECLLLFSERAIDNWFTVGDVQDPAEYRIHDLSDGIALVGLNSQPNKISNFNNASPELRHRTGGAKIIMSADSIQIEAPSGVNIIGNVTVVGDVVADGISLKTHVHGGVASGPNLTGVPQ